MSDPKLYTVGWICALAKEHIAARQFLDEEHGLPEHVAANDSNGYTLGKMAGHNVVIAVLPQGEYGTSSSASVATNMLNSFPNVRVGMMVGIGGGAPSAKNDIRLGDVVVSSPKNHTGGVYQYDYGKTIQGRKFQQTGFLNQPPSVVLTAVSVLASTYESDGHSIKEKIETILHAKPRLRKGGFNCPGAESDRLYKSDVVHPHDDCRCQDFCASEPSNIIQRRARDCNDDDPAIFHGIIASANSLMKDAITRDVLAKDGILCFEMEAAGLMNRFPCLVVRGICDYSDSHKNKEWQGYAAMTAAAYARDLLGHMVPKRVENEQKLAEALHSMSERITDIKLQTRYIQKAFRASELRQISWDISHWLKPSDPTTNLKKALDERHTGTCRWFHDSELYQSWKSKQNSFLWLHGLSGCGKTILASSIIDRISAEDDDSLLLLFFYFDFSDNTKQSLEQMLRTLLGQLYSQSDIAKRYLKGLYVRCRDGTRAPNIAEMCTALNDMAGQLPDVVMVVEAVDESHERENVVSWINDIHAAGFSSLHMLVTSRMEGSLSMTVTQWPQQDEILAIENDKVNADIRNYIHSRLHEGREFDKWDRQQGLHEEVESKVLEKSDGMFRLAACQLDTLRTCINRRHLIVLLQNLPGKLQDIYARMLAVIQACPCKREAITLLQLLVWSDRPLEMTELIDALTVRPEETPAFKEEDRLFDPMDIVEYCSSLVVVVAKDERASVRLAHSSVKEYLTSRSVGVPLHETFSETTARAYIVRLCVAYMSSLDYARLELRELVGKYPFAEYAGSSWPEHARMVATMDGSLIRLIQEFLWNKDAISACLRYHSSSQNHSLRSTVKQSDALHYAAFFGLEAVSEQLLNEGANPNLRIDGRLMTPLQAAAFEGHHNVVQMLLDNGADPNVSDGIRGNALAAAVQYGHFETARILLERGSHVNAQSCGRGSALHVAAYLGHCKLVQLLLDFGSDVNARAHTVLVPADDDNDFPPARVLRKSGCYETIVQTEYRQQRTFTNYHLLPAEAYGDGSPLLAAILYNHQAAIRILVERGADVNFRSDICGTPLGAAAAEGQQSTIEFLLDRGADINTQDRFGTALHIAVATGGDERIIGTLLDRGADVRATGGRYGTVLQAAVITRNRPALRLLLERGADIQATVNPHGTALQAAAFVGNRSALKLMLDRGADVDAREGEYGSALQAAAARGYRSIVKLLLKQGASVDACETPAWTALHAAIDNDKATVVDILLKHGASLELRGKFGTALQVASNGATLRIVRTLLDCGADVNASPAYHGTALIVAASRGDRRITRLLLQHGAEVDQKVMLGPSALHKQSCFHQTPCTALWIAMVRGHKRVAGMLLNAGAPWPSDDELGMLHKEHLLFEYSRGTQTVEESQCHSFDRLTYLAEIEDDDGEEEEGVEYPDDLDDDTDHEEDTDND